jgi:signal transduction histidine kinase
VKPTPIPEPVTSTTVGPARAPRRGAVESVAIAEEVASVLRHDLRNKFASMRNAVAYIERSLQKLDLLDRDLRILRFLKLIAEQLEASDRLLDQRGQHTELFSLGSELLCLDQCVLEAIARTAIPERVKLELGVMGQPTLQGNFDEVVLAVQCLLDNAVEASEPRGRIKVDVCEEEGEAVLRIADSGPGIAPEQRERVLTAFVGSKPGHAGLGLNIAARLAGLHGGRLMIGEARDLSGFEARLAFTKRR